jgi:hypothetical protein
MISDGRHVLTVGKAYKVQVIHHYDDSGQIMVHDNEGTPHYFDFSSLSEFFYVKGMVIVIPEVVIPEKIIQY